MVMEGSPQRNERRTNRNKYTVEGGEIRKGKEREVMKGNERRNKQT